MSMASVTLPVQESAGNRCAPTEAAGSLRVRIIERRRRIWPVNLREMWRYRELLYFLVWRDIKVQYKQTVLGPAWAVIRPVAQLVIFSVVFGSMANFPSDNVPYPIFAFAGMLPWMFFAAAVNQSSASLVQHAGILSKVYFPRALLPAACMGSSLVNFAINFAIYVGLMIAYRHLPGPGVLLLPLLVVLTAAIALGIGYLLAGLTVIYRDLRFVIGSVVQALMFLTPVIYPVDMVPPDYRWLLLLNPMTGVIGAFRSVLLNHPVDVPALLVSVAFAAALLVVGLMCFGRTERRFADIA